MQNPLRKKYDRLYMNMALAAAQESPCERHKIGAVVVLPSGMLSVGFNGTHSGGPDSCESGLTLDEHTCQLRKKTDPTVIHAENNAIKKLLVEGISIKGAKLYVTVSPCVICSTWLVDLGLSEIVYLHEHDDVSGLEILRHKTPLRQLGIV